MKISPLEMFTIKRIFDFIPISILAIDTNREIFFWNEYLEKKSGMKSYNVLGTKTVNVANKIYSDNNHLISEILFDDEFINKFENFDIKVFDDHIEAMSQPQESITVKVIPVFNKQDHLMGAFELIFGNRIFQTNGLDLKEIEKIFIVDDSKLSRSLLRKHIIHYSKAEIFEFSSGNDLISRVFNEKPDLIFIDLLMPGIQGDRIAKAIKENLENIKVVILTANIQKKIEQNLREIGVDYYLKKPITEEKIKNLFVKLKENN